MGINTLRDRIQSARAKARAAKRAAERRLVEAAARELAAQVAAAHAPAVVQAKVAVGQPVAVAVPAAQVLQAQAVPDGLMAGPMVRSSSAAPGMLSPARAMAAALRAGARAGREPIPVAHDEGDT